jgi:hypothetical protein
VINHAIFREIIWIVPFMAKEKNLLQRLLFLTPEDRKKIEFAWAHAPSRYVTNHILGRPAAVSHLGLLSLKKVMDALREVNRVYGTEVHDTLRTLEMPLRELRARRASASACSAASRVCA